MPLANSRGNPNLLTRSMSHIKLLKEEEEEEEEETTKTKMDGLQTPLGLETPTVTGGLKTPDLLELCKNSLRVSDVVDLSCLLYQVVPKLQTSVCSAIMCMVFLILHKTSCCLEKNGEQR